MTQLYTKHVSDKGRVTYKEHKKHPTRKILISDEEICTMVLTWGTVMMDQLVKHHKPHMATHRSVTKVVDALRGMKFDNKQELNEETITLAVSAWDAGLKVIQEGLM